jgi:hypothetical protein
MAYGYTKPLMYYKILNPESESLGWFQIRADVLLNLTVILDRHSPTLLCVVKVRIA